MRLSLLLLAVVSFAQTQEKSAVQGRVVSAVTGAPLKKAAVWLEPFSPTRNVNGGPSVALPATTTDAEGRFTLDNVEPGSYFLAAHRNGYLDQGYGAAEPQVVGPPLDLAAGQTMRDVALKLTPQSLVYGKVLDEDGDAIPNARVQALRASYAGGRRHLVEAGATDSQDDGSFVIGYLTPGRYYLSATFGKLEVTGPPARKVEREGYVTTYLPSASDAAAAAPVEVSPGAEVRGLAIRLRKSVVFHIRGRVVNAGNGAPGAHVFLRLVPKNEAPSDSQASVSAGSDGRFEFEGVLPGTYNLETNASVRFVSIHGAEPPVTSDPALIGRVSVVVTDSDIEDVVVPVGNGVRISGTITGAQVGQVSLQPGDAVAQIQPDGSFELDRLLPGIYTLDVGGLPEGSYVKALNFAGRPVEDWKIDVSSGAGGVLLIDISPDAGEVSGVVRNASGDPASGATVQVWPAGGDTARSVKAGPRGEFRVKSLPPGDYRVAAFQDLDDDLAQYAPFRVQFESRAAKVKIAEKARERVELSLIVREAIELEASKLK